MTFRIETFGKDIRIIDVETEFSAGRLIPQYRVLNDDGDEIAVVKSREEAVAVLANYAASHPPRWERRDSTKYLKLSWYGVLLVERTAGGHWLAYRNYCPLVESGSPVIFLSHSEAQRAADAHLRDGYPSAKETNDKFAWMDGEDGDDPDLAVEIACDT